jgi:hypothetical protein
MKMFEELRYNGYIIYRVYPNGDTMSDVYHFEAYTDEPCKGGKFVASADTYKELRETLDK